MNKTPLIRANDTLLLKNEKASLCDTLDRLLATGVVISGKILISVANIDLLYIDLQLLLSSINSIQHKPENNA